MQTIVPILGAREDDLKRKASQGKIMFRLHRGTPISTTSGAQSKGLKAVMDKREQEQLERLKNKLTQLRKNGWKKYINLLGEYTDHKFILDPPYSEKEVSSFEKQYGVTLPSQFRTFITTLGSSGAGPHYGLVHMSSYIETNLVDNVDDAQNLQGQCQLEDKKYEDNWLAKIAGDDWEKKLYDDASWNPYQGMISIADHGCIGRTALVINGPLKGRLFHITVEPDWSPWICPHLTFFDWYEAWLDAIIAEKEDDSVGVYDHKYDDNRLDSILKKYNSPFYD